LAGSEVIAPGEQQMESIERGLSSEDMGLGAKENMQK
jgi:hypothetical protein